MIRGTRTLQAGIALVLGVAGLALAIDVSFTERPIDSAFNGATAVHVADVNGDGDLDVLGAGVFASDIVWWENNNGIGTSWSERAVDLNFTGAESVHAGDINGDHRLDLVGAAAVSGDVSWWQNLNGAGTSWAEHPVDTNFFGAKSVVVADVDDDGVLDIVAAAEDDDRVVWWENTLGNGLSWTEREIDGAFAGAFAVFAADVNGDGDLDVLGAASFADDVVWWENLNGAGTSWAEHPVDTNFGGAASVHAADLDGDDDLDILAAAELDDDVTWWENLNGAGTSWSEHTVDANFGRPLSVWADDVDGDGDQDVLAAGFDANDVTWWENLNGLGTSWTERTIDPSFSGAAAVTTGDINGDGLTDVIAAAETADDVNWWQNLTPPPAICGDLDEDGFVDASDVAVFRAALADPIGAPLTVLAQSRCTVIDPPSACDVLDLTVIRRVVEGPDLPPGIAPVCSAVFP